MQFHTADPGSSQQVQFQNRLFRAKSGKKVFNAVPMLQRESSHLVLEFSAMCRQAVLGKASSHLTEIERGQRRVNLPPVGKGHWVEVKSIIV